MLLAEMFDPLVSIRKTVWKKRGAHIERREVSRIAATDVHPRTHVVVKDDKEHDDGAA